MNSYKALNKQIFTSGKYSIVPIRMEDRYEIMKWRNEQIYHLRQSQLLTRASQDEYFENVVSDLFKQESPEQILFSYLENDSCIGYGGLVHINWIDKNAEISFVLKTDLEHDFFEYHWVNFLELIERVGFGECDFKKIYTYAFDLRPMLYVALDKANFKEEAILKEHCFFDNNFIDVKIHSKINDLLNITYRKAQLEDAKIFYEWVNDNQVRTNSLTTTLIKWDDHLNWFKKKVNSESTQIFIFFFHNEPIGQVRLELEDDEWIIDYSIKKGFRGKGFGTKFLKLIVDREEFKSLKGYVKDYNIGSIKVFNKLGFKQVDIKSLADFNLIEFQFKRP